MSADAKKHYSRTARKMLRKADSDSLLKEAYILSQNRKRLWGENWSRHKVNINDVVKMFAPDATIKITNKKLTYKGTSYKVVVDLYSNYLRIYKIETREYVKLDGSPGSLEETHFQIKHRKEM